MLWQTAKGLGTSASQLTGLPEGSYEAYCLDQAVTYFGLTLENKLEEAGNKPDKETRKIEAARKQVIDKVFGDKNDQGSGFADPALMFQ